MYGPADRRETGMNAGAINFLIKRFDEQPVLESDLPQIAAGVFQADDVHGGIAGDFARGVRSQACARFGLLAPHACRPAVSGVIHGCPLRADSVEKVFLG